MLAARNRDNHATINGNATAALGALANASAGIITGNVQAGTDITNNGQIILTGSTGMVQAGNDLIMNGNGINTVGNGLGVIWDTQASGAASITVTII